LFAALGGAGLATMYALVRSTARARRTDELLGSSANAAVQGDGTRGFFSPLRRNAQRICCSQKWLRRLLVI
jgi:hypothetical protein